MNHPTAAVSALALCTSAGLAQTSTWNITTDGFWSVPTNWTPVNAPINASSNANIPSTGTYTIRVSGNYDTNNIFNFNPNATIQLDLSRQHTIHGDVINEGTYAINPGNGASVTTLVWDSTGSLTGAGEIALTGSSSRARLSISDGSVLNNGAAHTIRGFGQIFGDIVNSGTIEADNPFSTLDIRFGAVTNNGTIRAINNGILILNFADLIIDQSASGVLRADGGTVEIKNASVSGGTVESTGGSVLEIDGVASFDDLTMNGSLWINLARTLNLSGVITNTGTLTVNPNNGAAVTDLDIDGAVLLTGPGTVRLNGSSTRARITSAESGSLTQAAGHTIVGYGRIEAPLTNNGLCSASDATTRLWMSGSDKINNAVMAADGGVLEFESITVDQTGGGVIASNSGAVEYDNTTILGGTLTAGSGIHTLIANSAFEGVTLNAALNIEAARTLSVSSSITNNGSITVNPNNGAASTALRFADDGALLGSGTVNLNGTATRAQLSAEPGVTITNSAAQTIRGYGQITAPITNDGQITADVASQRLTFTQGAVQNNNTIRAAPGAILELDTSDTLIQSVGAKIASDDAEVELEDITIIGGSLDSTGTGTFEIQSTTTLDSVTNNAAINVQPARTLAVSGTLINNGTITVNPTNSASSTQLRVQSDQTLSGTGTLNLNGLSTRALLSGLTNTETVTNGTDHTISGSGIIETNLINDGTLAPGNSVGTLNASNDITMSASGVYACEVIANNNADRLNLTSGSFAAGGTLEVEFIDGFNPNDVWTATIVDAAGGVTGAFDTVDAPESLIPLLEFKVGYFANEIKIGYVCAADFDLSGTIDFFDLSLFLSLFSESNPAADIDGNGVFDFFDVSAYLQLIQTCNNG